MSENDGIHLVISERCTGRPKILCAFLDGMEAIEFAQTITPVWYVLEILDVVHMADGKPDSAVVIWSSKPHRIGMGCEGCPPYL